MSERTTPEIKAALTIAGSDPSGGAGIQGDLKTFATLDVFGCAVVTAITVQNTTAVKDSQPLDADLVAQQIDAVASDIPIAATKTGMLANAQIVKAVAGAIKRNKLAPLIVDPVMVATTGAALLDDDAVKVLCDQLLPLAAAVTPNTHEAARMLGKDADAINDIYTATDAAREICNRFGVKACVVTGLKQADDHEGQAVDIYFDGKEVREVTSDWRLTSNTHGSGCTFSAAITGALALGQPIDEAIQTAKAVVSEAIRQTTSLGHGNSPVNHLAYLKVKK